LVLVTTLTCAPLDAFPQPTENPDSRKSAVAGLTHGDPAARINSLIWLAQHGGMADQPQMLQRLRDADPDVRTVAEQALWLLWSRSGDAAIDKLLAAGIDEMQAGRLDQAIASFGEVIRRRPAFAEGWNKRATAYYLAGDFQRSLTDCDEVMKRNRSHFGALSGYGQIWFQLEQYEKAIAAWKRALAVNPNMGGVAANIEAAQRLLDERRRKTI
jgi:tetratricopeptide (TPR) repeat protein